MDSARYRRLHEIFSAVSSLPLEQRDDAIVQQCGADPELRAQIEVMLAHDSGADSELEQPALGQRFHLGSSLAHLSADADLVGQRLGQYQLTRVIATGGMGTVYEAEQEKPHRTVAVKVMKFGITSPSAMRRFEYEAQILARLHHPGIAQIHEAGTFDTGSGNLPYFVMEYIANARPITDYAREHKLTSSERLDLFARVCYAVSHGHQKGIIHRDLKPANILIDAAGDPKVIDFGVARSTDSDMAVTTLRTDVGQLIGTLQYMSPEQCEADPHDLDTRTDVYALGVVLFELLTDQLPYDVTRAAIHEAVQVVREATPIKPSSINRTLRGDVETIALKTLEKERERRYQSLIDVAQDIQRYLNNEPIAARPASTLYHLRKFVRRHRGVTGAVAAILIVLTGAFAMTVSALSREAEQRERAEQERGEADHQRAEAERQERIAQAVNEFLRNELLRSVSPSELGHEVTMREVLDAASERMEGRFAEEPLIAATIHQTIAMTYFDLGEFEPAEQHLTAAIDLYHASAGPKDDRTLRATIQLAGVYEKTTRLDEADALLAPILETARDVFGDEHELTANTLTELGHVAFSRSNYRVAEQHYREAMRIQERIGHEDIPTKARTLNNLAISLRHQNRFDEAEPLYEEALALSRQVHGDEHPETLLVLNNLGSFYFATKQFDRAVEVFEDLVMVQERVMPENHWRTLLAKANLAINYQNAGRTVDARALLEAILPVMRDELGQGDYYTLVAANNLAGIYRDTGDFEKAEPLFRQTIDDMADSLGPTHDFYVETKGNLARLFVKQQRYSEADELYRAVVETYSDKYAPRHRALLSYRLDRAVLCLMPWGRLDEAEEELLALHELLQPIGERARGMTNAVARSLVELYEQRREPDRAAHWRDRLPPANDSLLAGDDDAARDE